MVTVNVCQCNDQVSKANVRFVYMFEQKLSSEKIYKYKDYQGFDNRSNREHVIPWVFKQTLSQHNLLKTMFEYL